jgi:hypothetical protein
MVKIPALRNKEKGEPHVNLKKTTPQNKEMDEGEQRNKSPPLKRKARQHPWDWGNVKGLEEDP